jgi:hypothetical protein
MTTTLNRSNKATAGWTGASPTLDQVISDLTDLRDSVGASGSAALRVIQADDAANGTTVLTSTTNIYLVFEWDATP